MKEDERTDRLGCGDRLGSYVIGEEIGRGGMGVVYRAHDPSLERDVAIKVIPCPPGDGAYSQRLLREARIMGRIDHPHIVGVFAAGHEGDRLFIVMPLVRGESLADRLAREGTLPVHEALRITRETALALKAASEAGIIHRDIKPDNILLDAHGHVKVADFGLSRDLQSTHSLTVSCGYVGTPRYSSPEQWLNQPLDVRSDIYSLGICLYEMLTGRPAFDASSLATLMQQILSGDVPPIAVDRADISTDVRGLLTAMIASAPEHRPESAQALLDAMDVISLPTEAAAEVRPTSTAPPRKARGAVWLAVAVCLIVIVGGAAWRLSARPAVPPATADISPAPTTVATAARAGKIDVYVTDFVLPEPLPKDLAWLRVAGPNLVMGALGRSSWISSPARTTVELQRRETNVPASDVAGMTEVIRKAGADVLVRCTLIVIPGARDEQNRLDLEITDLGTGRSSLAGSLSCSSDPDRILACLSQQSDTVLAILAEMYQARYGSLPKVRSASRRMAWVDPDALAPPSEGNASAPHTSAPAAAPARAEAGPLTEAAEPSAAKDATQQKIEALNLYARGCELSAETDPKTRAEAKQCFERAQDARGGDFPEAKAALEAMQRDTP